MDRASQDRHAAEQAERQFRAARADHAGQRHDLSGLELDRDVAHPLADCDAFGAQHGFTGTRLGRPRREEISELAPDHHRDQAFTRNVRDLMRADETTILQYGDTIADRKDLIEAMGNEEHRYAALEQATETIEQQRHLASRNHG